MAIFKSLLLSDIRGSIAGATFSRTRAGNIIRNRTQPVQPNTPAQADRRQFMSQATDYMRSLSQLQVDEWADAIAGSGFTVQNALGDSYVPSAKQVVTSIFLNFRAGNISDNPDVSKFLSDANLPDILTGTITIKTDTGTPAILDTLSIEVGSSVPSATAIVAATPPLSASIRNYKKYLRNLTVDAAGPITAPAAIAIAADYNTKYPSIDWNDQTGNVIGLAVKVVNDANGLGSAWSYVGTVVIPAPTAP